MKIISLFLYILLFKVNYINAQADTRIKIEWASKILLLNQQPIDKHTSLSTIRKILGRETRTFSDPQQPTQLQVYDSLGLAFVVDSARGILHRIDIVMSPGRGSSSTASEKFYTGTFEINNYSVSKSDSIEKISQATGIISNEWAPGFYWYTMKNEIFDITIAYATKQRNRIRQVHIVLENLPQ